MEARLEAEEAAAEQERLEAEAEAKAAALAEAEAKESTSHDGHHGNAAIDDEGDCDVFCARGLPLLDWTRMGNWTAEGGRGAQER